MTKQDSNYLDIKLTFAQNHKITHLGIDNEKSRLATGTGEDIRVWVQNKEGTFEIKCEGNH